MLVLCYAEVGSRFCRTGGGLLFAREAHGELAGSLVGWMMLAGRLAGWAAISNAMVTASDVLVPGAAGFRVGILCALFGGLAVVNCAGVRMGARVGNFFTVAKLLPILIFLGVGVFSIDSALYRPFAPHGFQELGSGTVLILFAFVGFELVAVPAGEVKEPRRNVPLALVWSMSVVMVVYLAIWAVCAGTLAGLAGSEAPVSDAAAGFMGSAGRLVVSLGILCSVLGVNANAALAGPRTVYALARAGSLPSILGRVQAGSGAPVPAILALSAAALAIAIAGSFAQLAVIAVVGRLVQYISTALAVLVLRARRPGEEPAFRIPLGSAVPILAVLLCVWLLTQTERRKLLLAAGVLVLGVVVHYAQRRFARRRRRQA